MSLQKAVDDLSELVKSLDPKFPDDVVQLVVDTEGAAKLATSLPELLPADAVAVYQSNAQKVWENIGFFYFRTGRYYEAALLFWALYEHLLLYQKQSNERCHKGVPLFWFGQCHWALGNKVISKRYVMLALCEDAIKDEGVMNTADSGSYWKLVWEFGLSDDQVNKYLSRVWKRYQRGGPETLFPEWALQHLGTEWMVEVPNTSESGLYIISRFYVEWLLSKTGDKKGKYLECLAQYLIGAMPGCRSFRHVTSKVSDYDVVGALEGAFMDFRSELGRYMLVECKDWSRAANFTTVAKFCRVLDSAKCRFGLLFSRKGVSGSKSTEYAQREIVKVFQDRGIIIVVITKHDLEQIVKGRNFLAMLRKKYEIVRLDLHDELRDDAPLSKSTKKAAKGRGSARKLDN